MQSPNFNLPPTHVKRRWQTVGLHSNFCGAIPDPQGILQPSLGSTASTLQPRTGGDAVACQQAKRLPSSRVSSASQLLLATGIHIGFPTH